MKKTNTFAIFIAAFFIYFVPQFIVTSTGMVSVEQFNTAFACILLVMIYSLLVNTEKK